MSGLTELNDDRVAKVTAERDEALRLLDELCGAAGAALAWSKPGAAGMVDLTRAVEAVVRYRSSAEPTREDVTVTVRQYSTRESGNLYAIAIHEATGISAAVVVDHPKPGAWDAASGEARRKLNTLLAEASTAWRSR